MLGRHFAAALLFLGGCDTEPEGYYAQCDPVDGGCGGGPATPSPPVDKQSLLVAILARQAQPGLTTAQRLDLAALYDAIRQHPDAHIPGEVTFVGCRISPEERHAGMPGVSEEVPYVQVREVGQRQVGQFLTTRYVFEPLGGFSPGERRRWSPR